MAIEIYNNTFDHFIYFLHKDKEDKWKKDSLLNSLMSKDRIDEYSDNKAFVYSDENGCIFIVADKNNIPVLAHECLHAVIAMLDFKNITDMKSNDSEPFTYTLEWLLREIINIPEKGAKKKSKNKERNHNVLEKMFSVWADRKKDV